MANPESYNQAKPRHANAMPMPSEFATKQPSNLADIVMWFGWIGLPSAFYHGVARAQVQMQRRQRADKRPRTRRMACAPTTSTTDDVDASESHHHHHLLDIEMQRVSLEAGNRQFGGNGGVQRHQRLTGTVNYTNMPTPRTYLSTTLSTTT